jgi:ABC-type uncharacterized transport system substrate-binding protein
MKSKILFLAFLFFATNVSAAEKTILVIESYHSGYAWDASYLDGLRESFAGQYKLVTFEMDTKRQPRSLHQKQADLAWQKYEEVKPDLVILGDDNALKFLGPKFSKTQTPIVFLGINKNPRDYVEMSKNITGVLERPIFTLSIGSITDILQPKPDKILVLFDSGTTSQASVEEVFKGKTSADLSGTKVDLRLISNFELWQKTVLNAADAGYDAIVIGLYHTIVSNDGKNIPADQVMAWTSANTTIPPFGFWDFSVGKDQTIGGFVLYGKEQGRTAAKMAMQILQGKAPKDIRPVIGDKGQYVFSKSGLEKFQLTLPEKIASKASLIP